MESVNGKTACPGTPYIFFSPNIIKILECCQYFDFENRLLPLWIIVVSNHNDEKQAIILVLAIEVIVIIIMNFSGNIKKIKQILIIYD